MRRSNLPMLGIGALAIPVALFGVVPRILPGDLSVRDAQTLAATRGLTPAEAHPPKGTSIYQWDPDISDAPPYLVGRVTNPRYGSQAKRFVLVKAEHGFVKNLALDIKPDGLRYWVKR